MRQHLRFDTLSSEVERRHGIAIGAGLHALVPVDAGATEVSAEASRGDARCMPQTLRIRCTVLGDCRHIRRTSADIVFGFWALPIQSRQSAVLKAHCWHAQAQLTSAWLCRWHPPEERMRAAAHARQPDARHARPYFDYHHAENDTFDAVNKRELELGAATMTSLIYLMDTYGVKNSLTQIKN